MTNLQTEPTIEVGIITEKDFSLNPIGDWETIQSSKFTVYLPLSGASRMEVSGVIFGKGFHWERTEKVLYEGRINLFKMPDEPNIWLTNKLPLESYVRSVVGSEMHPDAPKEFLKAEAIMSRTWALRKTLCCTNPSEGKIKSADKIITWQEIDDHGGFDVCSDDHCQRYQGLNAINPRSLEIVDETRGIVLMDTCTNTPADTRFSKCCGGKTELFSTCWSNSDFRYLTSIPDPYCNPERLTGEKDYLSVILKDYDKGTDYYEWREVIPASLIQRNLKSLHNVEIGDIIELKPLKRGPSRRIYQLLVKGSQGEIIIGKELAIRRLLSESHLFSSAFEVVSVDSDGFHLEGKGWGHGVGLCQIGAAVMAKEGDTAEEILSFYFPGTQLKKIY